MQLLKTFTTTSLDIEVVPAALKDASQEVYHNILYSLYTVRRSTKDISVGLTCDIIVTDLVQHVGVNGELGYWCGIALPKDFIDSAEKVYTGWGTWDSTADNTPVTEFISQSTDSAMDGAAEDYYAFYWDASLGHSNSYKGYVVVRKDSVNYEFIVTFNNVGMITAATEEYTVNWDAVTVDEIKDVYLFGLSFQDQNGNPFSMNLFIHYINAAIDWLENYLDICISERTFEDERHDYIREDYRNWCYIGVDHVPVKRVEKVTLLYGQQPSIEIPDDWVQLNKLTGQITLFPSAGSASQLIIGQTGLLFGFQSMWDYAPQLWQTNYVAGIDMNDKTVPVEMVKEAVYKRAACQIMGVIGDLIIGAGIASQSVSIDGLSQSISTTQSAMYGGMSARTQQYENDLKNYLLPILRQKFGGIRMTVV